MAVVDSGISYCPCWVLVKMGDNICFQKDALGWRVFFAFILSNILFLVSSCFYWVFKMFASLWPSSSKSFRDLDVSFILKGWNRFWSARGVIIFRCFFHLHKRSILRFIVGIYDRLSFLKGKVGLGSVSPVAGCFLRIVLGCKAMNDSIVNFMPFHLYHLFLSVLLVEGSSIFFIHLSILSIIFHLFCKKIRIAH